MACLQCGNPHVELAAGQVCDCCELDNKRAGLVERGQRATGHGVHDDPGPHGDYGEREADDGDE